MLVFCIIKVSHLDIIYQCLQSFAENQHKGVAMKKYIRSSTSFIELNIKNLLEVNGMTIEELSDETGISEYKIRQMVNNKTTKVDLEDILKIAEILDVTDIQELIIMV